MHTLKKIATLLPLCSHIVQHMVRIRTLLKRIVTATAASAHILVITDNKMDIKKLWEHYENMVAQDDHLRRSITELENERADVQAEIRETLTAIESIQGEIDWG